VGPATVATVQLPSGTVTFLFTDLRDSTRLWEEHPDEMRRAVSRHDLLVRSCVENNGGAVVKSTGDGLMAAFGDASDAVSAAIDAQRAIGAEPWTLPIAARMGLHTGTAHAVDDDYHAPAVNRAARIAGAAHPEQVLVSSVTAGLADRGPYQDLGEHRLKGLPSILLLQVLADGLRADFPALASSTAAGTRLPSPLTSFIGREAEVDAVCRLLGDHRLVTLTGVGGCGKTRLAIEVASQLAPTFSGGARFVDLASVSDEARVLDAIAGTLELAEDASADPLDRVSSFVARGDMLLVLDNCEHLLDVSADFVEAVLGRPGSSRILTTSREALAVPGEQIHAVRSLEVDTDAVRLFVDRVGLVRPGFVVDQSNDVAVAEICRRLDGIPLAIELAAGQAAHLSVDQLLDRLNDRFRLLVGGRRRVQRQQTLSAALDWSHGMLTAGEQACLRRLAVFPASFPLSAAQGVVESEDTVGEIGALVAKSLVDVVDGGDQFRYRLLETVRMYAEERLVERGEAEQCRGRLVEWVLRWLESAPLEERWFGDDDWLAVELPTIRAALAWADTRDMTEALARIASGVDWTRGECRSEGLDWCLRASRADDLAEPLRHQLVAMVTVLRIVSLDQSLGSWIDQAVSIAEGEPNCFAAVVLAWSAAVQSVRALADGDEGLAAEACRSAERSVAMSDTCSAPWQTYCRFVAGMAFASLAIDDPDNRVRAEEHFRASAELAQPGPPYVGLRATLYEYLALFELLGGDPLASVSLAVHAPSGRGHWPLFGPNQSAARMLALAATGDLASAQVELQRLHDAFRAADATRGLDTVCMYGGAVAAIIEDWERAATLLAAGRHGIFAGAEAALVYYHFRDLVRSALGAERARELRAQGMAMPLDAAIESALHVAGRS
jgi:predicted ATPase/class 3 adenylate cyclase